MEIQAHLRAFRQELQRLGWTEGRNIQFDEHWTGDDMDLIRANAASLLELKPDVIFALGGRVIPVLIMKTSSVPIVFPSGGDPVGTGWVKSLARPGGNITGFSSFEFSVIGKMLEILRQIAPGTSRVAFIYNPNNRNAAFYARSFERFAEPLAVAPIMVPISPNRPMAPFSSRLTSRSRRFATHSSRSPHSTASPPSIRTLFW
jgi:putative tryptophan/tyrosine transport system substrate-binding protein